MSEKSKIGQPTARSSSPEGEWIKRAAEEIANKLSFGFTCQADHKVKFYKLVTEFEEIIARHAAQQEKKS